MYFEREGQSAQNRTDNQGQGQGQGNEGGNQGGGNSRSEGGRGDSN